MLSYIWFYANNICQIRKTRIEVRVDLIVDVDTPKTAWLEVMDERDNWLDMADNNKKAKTDSLNIGLVEFDI